MRLNNVFSGRPAWFDRNPTDNQNLAFDSTIAPAGVTTRWTYTTPTGRKAMLESALAVVRRATAAGAAARCFAIVTFLPGGINPQDMAIASFNNNTVDTLDRAIVGAIGVLVGLDTVRAQTSDASTAGTVEFDVAAKVTEFDA